MAVVIAVAFALVLQSYGTRGRWYLCFADAVLLMEITNVTMRVHIFDIAHSS